jgi:hypothetical protein
MYQVQLVWNREFQYVNFGRPKETIKEAVILASEILNSGDGARVKKCQVIDVKTELVVVKSHEIH